MFVLFLSQIQNLYQFFSNCQIGSGDKKSRLRLNHRAKRPRLSVSVRLISGLLVMENGAASL